MFETKKEGKIIAFKTYNNMFEAELEKAILDEAGIDCFFSDENIYNALPIDSIDVGRIRLHIFEKDLILVNELINSIEDKNFVEEDVNQDK
jgi:hypothetical protein